MQIGNSWSKRAPDQACRGHTHRVYRLAPNQACRVHTYAYRDQIEHIGVVLAYRHEIKHVKVKVDVYSLVSSSVNHPPTLHITPPCHTGPVHSKAISTSRGAYRPAATTALETADREALTVLPSTHLLLGRESARVGKGLAQGYSVEGNLTQQAIVGVTRRPTPTGPRSSL